jgi:hypothetical protein
MGDSSCKRNFKDIAFNRIGKSLPTISILAYYKLNLFNEGGFFFYRIGKREDGPQTIYRTQFDVKTEMFSNICEISRDSMKVIEKIESWKTPKKTGGVYEWTVLSKITSLSGLGKALKSHHYHARGLAEGDRYTNTTPIPKGLYSTAGTEDIYFSPNEEFLNGLKFDEFRNRLDFQEK